MDPDDFPTTLTLKLNEFDPKEEGAVETLLDAFNSFEDDFLPLQDLCMNGGHPSPNTIFPVQSVTISTIEGDVITGSLFVSFTEMSPTGCRDLDWKNSVEGQFMYSLNIRSGECEFEAHRWKREYDPEEF